MTLVSQIITDAYRESNLIAVGVSPRPNEQAEAFRRLQNLLLSAIGNDAGEFYTNWPLGDFGREIPASGSFDPQYISNPPGNVRLISTALAAMTINFPVNPSPGCRVAIVDPFGRLAAYPVTITGNGRAIEGQAQIVLNENSINRSWFYRDDLGSWVRVTDLSVDGQFPLPPEFDDYFVTKLAMRINPRYGATTSQETVARLSEQKQELQNRYLQSANLRINTDASFNSRQSYENWGDIWSGGDTGSWARGGYC